MTNINQIIKDSLEECHIKGNSYLGDNFVECANEIRRLEEGVVYSLGQAIYSNHDKVYGDLLKDEKLREVLLGMLFCMEMRDDG
jgi:hypothetical protein